MQLQKVKLALMLPNLFADGLIVLCVVIGTILVMWPIFKCANGVLAEYRLQKFKCDPKILHTHYVVTKPVYNAVPFKDDEDSL